MSRIPALEIGEVSGEAKTLLQAVHLSLGLTPNMFKVVANSPAALSAMIRMNAALARSGLDHRAREAIALTVAEANGCDYCLSAHTALGARLGMAPDDLVAARSADAAEPQLDAILHFTRAVVDRRGHVNEATLKAVRAAGVTDAQIVEIILDISLNTYTNYLNTIAQTEIDFPLISAGAPA